MLSTRFRFSIRTLFVAVTIAAAGSFYFALPSLRADQFVRAVGESDASKVLILIENPDDDDLPGCIADGYDLRCFVRPITLGDLWNGEREVDIIGYPPSPSAVLFARYRVTRSQVTLNPISFD